MEFYTNEKRKKKSQLKEKNKIYFYIRNLRIIWENRKLDYKKINSFYIKMKKNNINYKLELLNWINFYLVFYISVLKLINQKLLI